LYGLKSNKGLLKVRPLVTMFSIQLIVLFYVLLQAKFRVDGTPVTLKFGTCDLQAGDLPGTAEEQRVKKALWAKDKALLNGKWKYNTQ